MQLRDGRVAIESDEHILRARRTAALTRVTMGVLGVVLSAHRPGLIAHPVLGVAGFAIILATSALFVPLRIEHPVFMVLFLFLTAVTFSLFGFLIGLWADGFEKLQLVPLLIVTPLTFLGGSFYAIEMLPPFWRALSLFNPVVYLISGFRWSFFGKADVSLGVSVGMTFLFLAVCLGLVTWIFRTGYRLKS